MKVSVIIQSGVTHEYGNVFSIHTDKESGVLDIFYGISNDKISNGAFSKSYKSGDWICFTVNPREPVNYSQPSTPYKQ